MTMRPTVLLALVLSGGVAAADWTRTPSTRSHDLAFGLAAAPDGTLYAGTIFQARFDAAPHGGAGATAPQGRNDSWVFAFQPDGAPRWARRIGGQGLTELRGLARLEGGRVAAAGYFLGDAAHERGTPVQSVGGADAFVAAFEPDGAPAWLASLGGKGADVALAVAAVGDGLVVAGSFEYAMRAGDANGAPRVLRAAGRRDAFVVRLDADGNVTDARAFGGPGDDRALAVAAAPDGGYAVLVAHQGGVALERTVVATRGGDDALVLAFDAGGALRGHAALGHDGPDTFESLAVASDGAVWVGGQFVGTPVLALAGRSEPLRSAGSSDVALVRYAPGFADARVVRLGNAAADTLTQLAPGVDGTVLVAGSGSGEVELGPARYESEGPRAWIARVDAGGRVRASLPVEADGITQATGLVGLDAGRVAIAGVYEKAMPLAGRPPMKVLGKTDVFVAVRTLQP